LYNRGELQFLKVFALLVLVLAAMRLCSWALTWLLGKALGTSIKISAVVSNAVCFAVFALLLYRDLMPGEPVDLPGLFFGLTAFLFFLAADFFWVPWRRRTNA
jgi:hypothetical protein